MGQAKLISGQMSRGKEEEYYTGKISLVKAINIQKGGLF